MDRIEKLERRTRGFGLPDHVVAYMVDIGEDPDEKRAEALVRYSAQHTVRPTDHLFYIATHIIAPNRSN